MNIFIMVWDVIREFFVVWIGFFLAPLKNFDMLWIIIPVYLSWIFTEIFQEKKSTSLGNAISNGTVTLWAGIDGLRYTVKLISEHKIVVNTVFFIKLLIAVAVLCYGLLIIIEGIKAKKITRYIGRMREVTYVLLVATPIFYNAIEITLKNFVVFVIGFPIFYLIVEAIDRLTPNPKTYEEDDGVKEESAFSFEKTTGPGREADSFNRQTPYLNDRTGTDSWGYPTDRHPTNFVDKRFRRI